VTFRDAISLAFRNLRQSKLRTFLTVLGVAIGIASLAGMVSLGVGLQDQFVRQFTRSGMFDSITVMPSSIQLGGPFGGGRGRGRGRANSTQAPDTPSRPLDDAALAELARLEHVQDVYPVVRVPVEVKYREATEFAQLAGVPMSVKGVGPFQNLPNGSFFANDADQGCLLSSAFATRLVGEKPEQLIGKDVTIGYASTTAGEGTPAALPGMPPMMQVQRVQVACRVLGIVQRETAPMQVGGANVSAVMVPLPRARQINAAVVRTQRALLRGQPNENVYGTLTVKVSHAQHTQDVQERIRKMGFSAFSLNDALEGAKRAFLILDIILGLIGSIALAVASLGIMNTMVMSILERTREIGIMKAIGGSDSDVRRIFLIEASVIGFLGGIAGVVLGWAVGRIINFGANQYIVSQGGTAGNLFSLPVWLVASAIGFSIVVSLAAGVYPARRAARLDPIHALRHD
jgi:ABC-type antimicrobial peptide transport system permease subunit